MTYILSELLL